MTESFVLFQFISALTIVITVYLILVLLVSKFNFPTGLAGLILLFTVVSSLFTPTIVARWYIIPNYGTTQTFSAKEFKEVEQDGKIIQYLVYEDGYELNLTENTGKYYTELPDSERIVETCHFLWWVNWHGTWHSNIDFLPRD